MVVTLQLKPLSKLLIRLLALSVRTLSTLLMVLQVSARALPTLLPKLPSPELTAAWTCWPGRGSRWTCRVRTRGPDTGSTSGRMCKAGCAVLTSGERGVLVACSREQAGAWALNSGNSMCIDPVSWICMQYVRLECAKSQGIIHACCLPCNMSITGGPYPGPL
jgi:hypothetical protein